MISIVIPAREEEKAIASTIAQFASLTIPHEVIVADGASSDRTVEIARAAGARVVENTSGARSPSKQRNDGARAASGEFIMFVDASVRFSDIDAFVRAALSEFEKEPTLVGMCFQQWIYPEIATFADRFFLTMTNAFIRMTNVGSGKCMLCRKSAYDAISGLREDLISGEDRDFQERLKAVGATKCHPTLYIEYSGRREHAWGWSKLLYVWLRDTLWITLFNKSGSTDWTPVR